MRPFCSGVSSGCHSGPRAVFGFSRDCSDALFGREAVEAFVLFCLLFFPFCGSHVSRGPCTCSQEGRPAGGLARSPCLSEGKGSTMPFSGGGFRPPPVWFLFASSVCFWPQGPTSLFCLRGHLLRCPLGSHTHFCSPGRSSLSFFFCSVFSLAVRREQNHRRPPQPPPLCCNYMYVGGNAVRFFAVAFFGNSPEIGRDRKGRQKNLVFPGISCDFVVGN